MCSQLGQRGSCFIKTDATFKREFRAKLSPAQVVAEVPYGLSTPDPKVSQAYGCFSITFAENLSYAAFRIDVGGVESVKKVDLHFGDAGHTGCTTAVLYGKDGEEVVKKSKFHLSGLIKNENLVPTTECPEGAVNVADLLNLIRLGMIYVEVTDSEDKAILRAQIFG